ncbi:glycosyltransferase [Bdellovibrio sp. HCB337]|uniref:glycosyltransferase n=1 Tax=Bdellovibrio sp. HCB337 TaxID=3394358 RepID=UPI0039A6D88D
MFSVLMAIYRNDNPAWLRESIDSLLNQTLKASEILIVKDGPLTEELETLLASYKDPSLVYLPLEKNGGLAMALRQGIEACKNELIARMDSDDVCHPDRFRLQYETFQQHPEVSLVGTSVIEFEHTIEDATFIRELPEGGPELLKYGKHRSPTNHATVMYRKSAVLAAGNYQNFLWNEDYHLWARMIQKGFLFKNIKPALLYVRGGQSMYRRRGGIRYAIQDIKLQKYFYKIGYANILDVTINLATRLPVRLFPNTVRQFVYEKFLRK